MKNTVLCTIWAGLFVLCAVLGLIPAPTGLLQVLMTCLSVLFFLPPCLLLVQAFRTGDRKTIALLRKLSLLSLGLTLLLLLVNILAVLGSEGLGTVLYYILALVSVPMVCSGHYVLSLFLWACLLVATLSAKKKVS